MPPQIEQTTTAPAADVAADAVHAFDEVHRTLLFFIQHGETAVVLSLVSLPSVGGDPLFWRTCTYHGGLAAAVLAANPQLSPATSSSSATSSGGGDGPEEGVPLPMLYSFLTRTLLSLVEQERAHPVADRARCKHLLLSVIQRIEATQSAAPHGDPPPHGTDSRSSQGQAGKRRSGAKRGRQEPEEPDSSVPEVAPAAAAAAPMDLLSLAALLQETCAGMTYVNPLDGLPPSALPPAPAPAGETSVSAPAPVVGQSVQQQLAEQAQALDAVELLRQGAAPLPGTTATITSDFDAVVASRRLTQTQAGSATDDEDEDEEEEEVEVEPQTQKAVLPKVHRLGGATATAASLAEADKVQQRLLEEQRVRAAFYAFDAFEAQENTKLPHHPATTTTTTTTTTSTASSASTAAAAGTRVIKRRRAFNALEDRAIIEGVGQFGQLPKAFNLIFAKYVQVWQAGRTAMGLYDHWRDALRSRARRLMEEEAAAAVREGAKWNRGQQPSS